MMRALVVGGVLLAAAGQSPKGVAKKKERPTPFCSTVLRYLDSASGRFADMEGAVDTPATNDAPAVYVAKVSLPGAHDCVVYHQDKPEVGPWVDCDFVLTTDEAVAKKYFDDAVKQVEGCLGTEWTVDRGQRLDGRQEFADFEKKTGSPYVTVARTRQKDSDKLQVLLSVTVPDR